MLSDSEKQEEVLVGKGFTEQGARQVSNIRIEAERLASDSDLGMCIKAKDVSAACKETSSARPDQLIRTADQIKQFSRLSARLCSCINIRSWNLIFELKSGLEMNKKLAGGQPITSMKTRNCLLFIAPVFFSMFTVQCSTAFAQGTAFAYQGRLNDGNAPATGNYDLLFTLYATNTTGTIVAGPVTNSATAVSNGLFTTLVDLGPGAFTGTSNWLELAVRTNGGAGFTTLTPRQQITPVPYALNSATAISASTATTAASANSVSATNISGALTTTQLSSVVLTNGASGVNISGTFSGNGGGLTNLNASKISSGTIPLAQLPGGVITNNETGVTITVSNLSVAATNQIAPLSVPPSVPTAAVGSVSTGTDPIAMTVAGNYAYVVHLVDDTLQIFDVSSATNPVPVGSVATGSEPNAIAVAGRYAYVVNFDFSDNTLQIFDVGNPASPVLAGSISVGSSSTPVSLAVAGRYVYVAAASANALKIFDVSKPSSPALVGSLSTGPNSNPSSIAVAGRYVYMTEESSNLLQVIDVSNPSAPVSAGSAHGASNPISLAVAGGYAYVLNFGIQTLRAYDVRTPTNPIPAGQISLGSGSGGSSGPQSVAVAGRYVYVVNSIANLFQIIDVSNPSNLTLVGAISIGASSDPLSIAAAGRYAYVTAGNSTLQVFNLGGAYVQQFEAGAAEVGTLQTLDTATVGNNLNVRGGLTVSASARISGGLSVDNGIIVATNFTGNGGGLTNLQAAQLSGTIPLAQLPATVITNNESSITLSNVTVTGNGNGLTNLDASQLTGEGNNNFLIGNTGGFITTGTGNTALGFAALSNNVSGNNNTAIGYDALHFSLSSGNTAIGATALAVNTNGSSNTAVGQGALSENIIGTANTAIGFNALADNATGTNNTAIGLGALFVITNGLENTAIGRASLNSALSGSNNIALGYFAGSGINGGNNNIYIGNTGIDGDNGIIRIGTTGLQTNTFIAGTINGNGGGLTNLTSLSSTNKSAFLVSGAFKTIAGMGFVSVQICVTNTQSAWLSNATTHEVRILGSVTGAGTNFYNAMLPAKTSDSVVYTNITGTPNFIGSWFDSIQ